MFFDSLENRARYADLSPRIRLALDAIADLVAKNAEPGKYVIDGENVYVNVAEGTCKDPAAARYENHKNYMDIQYTSYGEEKILVAPVAELEPFGDYDDQKDTEHYKLNSDPTAFRVRAGEFLAVYPDEAHAPCLALSQERIGEKRGKIVAKVKLK